jgi:4-hydroxy-4-methyl-2-oxoglutarate aldolase
MIESFETRPLLLESTLTFLRGVDSPTVANAIETLDVRDRRDGYIGGAVQCQFPDLGVMVGRALTVTMTSTDGVSGGGPGYWRMWDALEALAASGPVVVAIADVSGAPNRVAYSGEIMSTLAQRLGAVGMITDGALRDVEEAHQLGFHYFMRFPVVSHAYFEILGVGAPIVLDGERIDTGDLLHGDRNGIAVIPDAVLPDLPGAVETVRDRERDLMGFIRGADFSLNALKQRGGYSHSQPADTVATAAR